VSIDLCRRLLAVGAVTAEDVEASLFLAQVKGIPVTRALLDRGAITERALEEELERIGGLGLRQVVGNAELMRRLPRAMCRRLGALPVRVDVASAAIDVAAADPLDPHVQQELAFHLGAAVRVVRAPLAAIEEAIRRLELEDKPEPARVRRATPPFPHGAPMSSNPPPPAEEIAIPLVRRLQPMVPSSGPDSEEPVTEPRPELKDLEDGEVALPLRHSKLPSDRRPSPAPAGIWDESTNDMAASAAQSSSSGVSSDGVTPVRSGTLVPPPGSSTPPMSPLPPVMPPISVPAPSRLVSSSTTGSPKQGPKGRQATLSLEASPPSDDEITQVPRGAIRPQPLASHDARPTLVSQGAPHISSNPTPRGTLAAMTSGSSTSDRAGRRPPVLRTSETEQPSVRFPSQPPLPHLSSSSFDDEITHVKPRKLTRPAFVTDIPFKTDDTKATSAIADAIAVGPVAPVARVAPEVVAPESEPEPSPPPESVQERHLTRPVDGTALFELIRAADGRDALVRLSLRGLRMAGRRVAVFVAKRDVFVGWACNVELGDEDELRNVTVSARDPSLFATASATTIYVGPVPSTPAHEALIRVMERGGGAPSGEIAAVAARVGPRPALVLLVDELDDTLFGTRFLIELGREIGAALSRLLAR
jgi:hypothetical protein